jgi:DNA repair exonuclease SbcCD ATPase subunit
MKKEKEMLSIPINSNEDAVARQLPEIDKPLPPHLAAFHEVCAQYPTKVSPFYERVKDLAMAYKDYLEDNKRWFLFSKDIWEIRMSDVKELLKELSEGVSLTQLSDGRLHTLCQKIANQKTQGNSFGGNHLPNVLKRILTDFALEKTRANLIGKQSYAKLHEDFSATRQELSQVKEKNQLLEGENQRINELMKDHIKRNQELEDNVKALQRDNNILREELKNHSKDIDELKQSVKILIEKNQFLSKIADESFSDPVCHVPMIDPITLPSSGITYERATIRDWRNKSKNASGFFRDPITDSLISDDPDKIKTNYLLKNIIEDVSKIIQK